MNPIEVCFTDEVPHKPSRSRKRAIKDGLAFEKAAQDWFLRRCTEGFLVKRSPWISFIDLDLPHRRPSHAQPDMLLIGKDSVFILEMKLRHTPQSAVQLLKYELLISKIYPGRTIHLIEVYKVWDFVEYPVSSRVLNECALLALLLAAPDVKLGYSISLFGLID